MPYALRTFTCADCRGLVQRRLPSGSEARCHPCAVEYAAENARQLSAKRGPMYVRWLWATVTWARAQEQEIKAISSRAA